MLFSKVAVEGQRDEAPKEKTPSLNYCRNIKPNRGYSLRP